VLTVLRLVNNLEQSRSWLDKPHGEAPLFYPYLVFGNIPSTAETILGRHSTMEIRSIHLGGLFHAEEEIQMTSTMPNFVGQMQGLVFNGQRWVSVRSIQVIDFYF